MTNSGAGERDAASERTDAGERNGAGDRDLGLRVARWLPLVWGVVFFAIGLSELYRSHPQEDAYILFEYARNLAHGDGIVFFAGGPHAEGATDFLWMLALAASVRIGIDVAVAACLWNALGAALASWLLTRIALRAGARGVTACVFALLSGAVLGTCAALAGWAGFSAMFYAAMVLWLAELALDGLAANRESEFGARDAALVANNARWTPFVALAVALVRPDGVSFAIVFACASAVIAVRAGFGARWAKSALVAGGLGVAYFAWRRWYFGLPLPLPLYVKANGVTPFDVGTMLRNPLEVLPGAGANLHWIHSRFGPVLMLVLAVACALFLLRRRRDELARAGLILVAVVVFLALVSFGRQTQNYVFRIQAPAALLVLLAAWRLVVAVACDRRSGKLVAGGAVFAFVACSALGVSRTFAQFSWNDRAKNYMDVFPVELERRLGPGRSIVLTEAGRLAFWTKARTYDLIGLNDAVSALAPPTTERLTELAPDVVLFHVSDAVSLDAVDVPPHPPVVEIDARALDAAVTPIGRDVYEHGLARYAPGCMPESVAPAVIARYLVDHASEYRIFATRYFDHYSHVWGLRRDLPRIDDIVGAMRASEEASAWRSYAELAGLPFAR